MKCEGNFIRPKEGPAGCPIKSKGNWNAETEIWTNNAAGVNPRTGDKSGCGERNTFAMPTSHCYDFVPLDGPKNVGGKKDYKLKGIFMQADIKNRNGRIYPMEVLEKEVRRYNKDHIQQKRAFGELGHPEGPTINLERASHMITSLAPDGKNFIGEAKILKTPMGKIVESLMD